MEIEQGNTYIFVENIVSFMKTPFKGKVEEATESTYLIHNLDNNLTTRYQRKEFESKYELLETVSTKEEELKKIIELMKDVKPQIVKEGSCLSGPGQCFCTGACKIKNCNICNGTKTVTYSNPMGGMQPCPKCSGCI